LLSALSFSWTESASFIWKVNSHISVDQLHNLTGLTQMISENYLVLTKMRSNHPVFPEKLIFILRVRKIFQTKHMYCVHGWNKE